MPRSAALGRRLRPSGSSPGLATSTAARPRQGPSCRGEVLPHAQGPESPDAAGDVRSRRRRGPRHRRRARLLRAVSLCLAAWATLRRSLATTSVVRADKRRLPIAKSLQDTTTVARTRWWRPVDRVLHFRRVSRERDTAWRSPTDGEAAPRLPGLAIEAPRGASQRFPGALDAAARRERIMPVGKPYAALVVASAAAAAMVLPEEKTMRERLVELEAAPIDIAGCDFLTAVYGYREAESSYRAIRSAGYPKGSVDNIVIGPLAVLARRAAHRRSRLRRAHRDAVGDPATRADARCSSRRRDCARRTRASTPRPRSCSSTRCSPSPR